MSLDDAVNKYMIRGVARTDWLFGNDKKQKLTQENATLRHYNATLSQDNATLRQDNATLTQYYHELENLRAKFDECCKLNETLHVYATNEFNEDKGLEAKVKKLQEELVEKQEWYTKVFRQQRDESEDITQKLKKYTIAKTKMYELLERILPLSPPDAYKEIEDTLNEVDKLVRVVYRGNMHQNPN
jgi:hypothetical protein